MVSAVGHDAEADEDGEPGDDGAEGRAALVLIVLRGRRVVRASGPADAVEERVRIDRRDVQAAARDGRLAPDLVAEVVRPENLALLAVQRIYFPIIITDV